VRSSPSDSDPSRTCLDAKPQLTVERLDWLFHDGTPINTIVRYPYVSLLEDGFWHMPEFSGNCSINMDHIVYGLLDAARWDLGAIGNNNTHTLHKAGDHYVVAVRIPAGTINTQFICNIKKRKAWGSFIISVGSALFGVLVRLRSRWMTGDKSLPTPPVWTVGTVCASCRPLHLQETRHLQPTIQLQTTRTTISSRS
jgi:hypothetical protein